MNEKKKFEKTEILDDTFLSELETEIQKKYPSNTKELTKTNEDNKDEVIEILNDKFEELKNKTRTLEDTIELLKSDISFLNTNSKEEIEILEEEIDYFDVPSKQLENTIELLDIEIREKPIYVKSKIKPKKKPWIILLSICLITIFLTSYKTIAWHYDSRKTDEQIKNIINSTKVETTINKDIVAGATANKEDKRFEYLDVDFSNLKKQNNEVKGWIKVNNSNINYPFVQTSNNDFYLKHSFDKSYNSAGWVFADYRNNLENWDQNTILYAHGRLDNTMFGSLKQVVEKSWYENKDNYYLQVSTEKENTIWQVLSVYTIIPETYYITPNFNTENDFNIFLETIKERSIFNFPTNLTTKDKILTLSSCYNDELRVVLHAKLINTKIKEDEQVDN